MKGRILIAAYPCSGTKFMAELLKTYGISARHEKSNEDVTVSWRHVGEPDKPGISKMEFEKVLHQVRHPLKVLASAPFIGDARSEQIFRYNCAGLGKRDLEFYMRTYVRWDELSRGWNPVLRYQLEQLKLVWPEICMHVGLPVDTEYVDDGVTRNSHNRSNVVLTWEDLDAVSPEVSEQIFNLAKDYGYE